MTNPTNPPRTTTDPARPRHRWGMGVTDPAAKSTNPGVRAWWGIGALLAVMFVVAAAWRYGTTEAIDHRRQPAPAPRSQRPAQPGRGRGKHRGSTIEYCELRKAAGEALRFRKGLGAEAPPFMMHVNAQALSTTRRPAKVHCLAESMTLCVLPQPPQANARRPGCPLSGAISATLRMARPASLTYSLRYLREHCRGRPRGKPAQQTYTGNVKKCWCTRLHARRFRPIPWAVATV